MKTKIFGDKKIKIRKLSRKDLKKVRKFQDFINSLVKEKAQILPNKKFSLKEEKKWLKEKLEKIKKNKMVFLVAEEKEKIVGATEIYSGKGHQGHIGYFEIAIRKNYRRIGLGSYLITEIIKLAKKELKPRPKIIRLLVFSINKPAITLYKKFGFKEVAKIPNQISYKGKLLDETIMILYL